MVENQERRGARSIPVLARPGVEIDIHYLAFDLQGPWENDIGPPAIVFAYNSMLFGRRLSGRVEETGMNHNFSKRGGEILPI